MKQSKWVILALVMALVVVTGILIYRNTATDNSASGPLVTETVMVTPTPNIYDKPTETVSSEPPATTQAAVSSVPVPSAETTPIASAETSAATPVDGSRKPTNIPMTKLAPGEKPPQFIIFSFDGVGSSQKLNEFMDAAAPNDARFTGFLTGLYLLTDDNNNAYTAPGASQGSSQVGFGGPASEVIKRVTDLNTFYQRGNEVGTHYNGHFCELGQNWSTGQWNGELSQFFDYFTNWKTINGLPDAPDLVIPASEVKGGRTPCLKHTWNQVVQSWKDNNMTYDSSDPAPRDGIFWPQRVDGIWEFYMPYIYSPAFGGKVTAMDYNFWVKFNGAKEEPQTQPELTQKVIDTYNFMYSEAYNGNRAPILVANHLNNWNGNSFNPAAKQFMSEKCGLANTFCATYTDVIAWMEMQDPAVLDDLLNSFPVAYQAP
ncbi:polysaccharide deacetylase [Nakamurella antarctica]|uniref:Polysaccharide deacetylase n=1 Tax=Nakamurella antarctica TaxID=1902245 RepID=A0A3G8ZS00_9ACTN|nr:polysaccharide deacetylase [Nakamurella antarctica]AZI57284.1 polysaccharide deacetylase [Nakamurella antarctica]